MPKFSIILPIYNTEKYLDRCMDSVLNQTYQDFEIIMIDDGSMDSSPQICDEYANKDSRVKVIHKSNAGLGYARNTGLEISAGDYVLFLDSDDYISKETLKTVLSRIDETGAEICMFDYFIKRDSGKELRKHSPLGRTVLEPPVIMDQVLLGMLASEPTYPSDTYISMSVWKFIYLRELLVNNNLRFSSERECVSEDIVFHLHVMPHVRKMCTIDQCLYYYCENGTYLSLTKKYDENKFLKVKKLYDIQLDLLEQIGFLEKGRIRAQRRFLGNTRVCIKQIVMNNQLDKADKRDKIKRICNDNYLQIIINDYPWWKNPWRQKVSTFLLKHKMITTLLIITGIKG